MTTDLKARFEQLLTRLDTLLEARNGRERILIFILPALLAGFVAYEYLIPSQQQANRTVSRKLATITQEINTYQNHLSSKDGGSRHYLEKLESENRLLQEQIAEMKNLNRYAESRLDALGFVRFTPANWSDFLHRLVTYSTKNRIAMSSFSNRRDKGRPDGSGFRKVLSVDFNASGYYKNMIGFIRDIESDRAVTDIEKLTIRSGPKLEADLTLTLWGLVQ